MKNKLDDRIPFLNALIEYAEKSGTFNPNFYRREMMAILGISEGEFNVLQKRLGDKYCHFAGVLNDDNRYAIALDQCLILRDELEKAKAAELRHRQMLWATILASVLGSALGAVLGMLIFQRFFD